MTFVGIFSCVLSVARPGRGQVSADGNFSVGTTKRLLSSGESADWGPSAEASGHVAILPLVRGGVYVAADGASLPNAGLRRFLSAGTHWVLLSPWRWGPFRPHVFAGFGYAAMYSDSYATTLRVSDRLTTASTQDTRVPYGVEGAGGGFFEVPVGLGLTMRLRAPWELTLDVGARAGFGFRGSNYEGRTALPTSGYERYGTQVVGSFGADSLAVTLNGGIRFDM